VALPTASDNPFPSVLVTEGSAPASPAAGKQRVFIDSADHVLKVKNSAGTVTAVGGAGGSMATDTLWANQGDIAVATADDNASVLTKGATGTVLTAGASTLAYAYPPGYEIDYVEITSPVSISGASEGASNTCITGTNLTYANVPHIIEVFCPALVTSTSSGSSVVAMLYDGGTVLGRLGVAKNESAVAVGSTLMARKRITPTAATHQYIVKAWSTAGTGGFNGGAGGTGDYIPAYIRVTRV